jgi:hypothetical protein
MYVCIHIYTFMKSYEFVHIYTNIHIQTLPPTREYPRGRFFNHTVAAKDKWVQDNYFGMYKYT